MRTRATRLTAEEALMVKVCLNFTGCKPCDEHRFSFVPKFCFTGRICTPSIAENPVFPWQPGPTLRKDRFYKTTPTLPKLSGVPSGGGPKNHLCSPGRQQNFSIVGLKPAGLHSGSPSRFCRSFPSMLAAALRDESLLLESISQSTGTGRAAKPVHFSALGAMRP